MSNHQEGNAVPFEPIRTTAEAGITLVDQSRSINVYRLLEPELRNLSSSSDTFSLHLGLFSLAFGTLLTSASTLLIITEWPTIYTFAGFVAVLLTSIGLSLFFGIKACLAWREKSEILRDIRAKSSASE